MHHVYNNTKKYYILSVNVNISRSNVYISAENVDIGSRARVPFYLIININKKRVRVRAREK
jgi:hypothetical protein